MRQPMMRISRTLCSAAVALTVFASGVALPMLRRPSRLRQLQGPATPRPSRSPWVAASTSGTFSRRRTKARGGSALTDDLFAIWRQLAMRNAMKARGFTWAYWQLAAAFGIYQLGTELAGGVAGCAVSLGRT